jgi:predicted ATPase/class 3 adenylate cyclase
VTFLFTDIEGSTRLWERDPVAMQSALARHDEVLRAAIEGHAGHVFKTVGDAFCAAFPTATDALGAALEGQEILLAEEWDEGCVIRVRMALHTGAVEERGGDYFGPPVNRVARLLSAGHGGQTLLSHAARTLAGDQLPHDAELRDMGERRLKDLFRPERIFQLLAPDLPSSFPPLKTLDARVNNLPLQPTPLVGRERQLGEVAALVRREEMRLLTLVGPGGTGKTRLGLQVAAELLDEFEYGVFFVALASVADPGLVTSTIAGSLGVVETPEQPLVESLKDYLRAREILLLLDNFEQVVDEAPVVGELLSACPKLKVLVTSRIALKVYGEREYAVPPLALPDPTHLPPVERLTQYEAVRLFIERAQAAKAGFELTSENARAIAEICVRLDGLPLAIELAAARAKILPPEAMLNRLTNRLKLLRGGARDLPARQRTLRGAIDWSHDLLDEEERTLFRRLSVFAGGRTLEAIEEICDPEGELDALDGVESMVDKSLLRQEEQAEGEPRFVMLETIHEYAREKLQESGEAEEIKRSHAGFFLALAEEAEPELVGPDQVEWMDRLETEHDNLRAALSWSLVSAEAETALRLGGALWWFWYVRGHVREGYDWLGNALESGGDISGSVKAKALTGAGRLLLEQGDCDAATELLTQSVTAFRGAGSSQELAGSLDNLGIAQVHQGNLDQSKVLFEESLALFREAGERWGVAETLNNLAVTAEDQDEGTRGTALHEESLRVRRELGDKRGIAMSLANLANEALMGGDHERAATLSEEGLAFGRELGDKALTGYLLANLGLALLDRGNPEQATELLEESLESFQDLGEKYYLQRSLMGLASAAEAKGEAVRASRLWGATDHQQEITGYSLPPSEAALYEPYMVAARARLGEPAFQTAWEEGRAMTEEQIIALALEKGDDDVKHLETEPA